MGTNSDLLRRYARYNKNDLMHAPQQSAVDNNPARDDLKRNLLELQEKKDERRVIIQLGEKIRINKANLTGEVIMAIQIRLSFDNPRYMKNLLFGKKDKRISRKLLCFWEEEDDLLLARGFASTLIEIFHRHKVRFEIIDETGEFNAVAYEFNGVLLPYQKHAVREMGVRRFGVLVAQTGCGKKLIALHQIVKCKVSALIIVKSKYRFYQWREAVTRFLGIDEKEIGLIGDGHYKIGEKITIAIDRSLYRRIDELKGWIGFVVVDQCESTSLKVFTKAVQPLAARYVLGLAKKYYRADRLQGFMYSYLGPILHTVEAFDASGVYGARRQLFKVQKTFFQFHYQDDYSEMISALCDDLSRNEIIIDDILYAAAQQHPKVLVVSERIEHLQALKILLQNKYQSSAEIIIGKTSAKDREEIISRLTRGKLKILMTTLKSISTIRNVNNFSALVIASPMACSENLFVAIGKLNNSGDNNPSILYDYIDPAEILKNSLRRRIKGYKGVGINETLLPDVVH